MSATAAPPDVSNPFAPPTDMTIVTTPFLSGHRVTRVIGATFGLIVRSRGLGQNIAAYFRAWGGGEIKLYTQLLEQARHQAIERLAAHAKSLGANAVVAVGFDTTEMVGSMTEVLAYGTAVVVGAGYLTGAVRRAPLTGCTGAISIGRSD